MRSTFFLVLVCLAAFASSTVLGQEDCWSADASFRSCPDFHLYQDETGYDAQLTLWCSDVQYWDMSVSGYDYKPDDTSGPLGTSCGSGFFIFRQPAACTGKSAPAGGVVDSNDFITDADGVFMLATVDATNKGTLWSGADPCAGNVIRYAWKSTDSWSVCAVQGTPVTCGTGVQENVPACWSYANADDQVGTQASDNSPCAAIPKPFNRRLCNTAFCPHECTNDHQSNCLKRIAPDPSTCRTDCFHYQTFSKQDVRPKSSQWSKLINQLSGIFLTKPCPGALDQEPCPN